MNWYSANDKLEAFMFKDKLGMQDTDIWFCIQGIIWIAGIILIIVALIMDSQGGHREG